MHRVATESPPTGATTPSPPADNAIDRYLHAQARRMRVEMLNMIFTAGSGHVGSSLSCIDLISVLKFDQMTWSAATPRRESDVFVLSKGHAVPAWYAALIVSGELDRAEAATLRTIDSRLQGHPDRRRFDLVDVSTGALGQGLSITIGRAEAKRLRGHGGYGYCILGDGELQEGQVWEAITYAGARRSSNVIAFVDYNRSQNDGPLSEIMPMDPPGDKIRAFGWHVQEIDGHSHRAIRSAILAAKDQRHRPSMIVANTRKGYVGPDLIALNGSHSASLSQEDYDEAIRYLEVPT